MKRLRKFLSLDKRDHRLLVSAVLLLGMIRLGLWLLPFQMLRGLLTKMTKMSTKLHEVNLASVNDIIRAVTIASRYMPGGVKCLARALAAQVLLAQHGYISDLRIGVAKDEKGQLEAHAWVESQGRILLGGLADISRFTPLLSLGGGRL